VKISSRIRLVVSLAGILVTLALSLVFSIQSLAYQSPGSPTGFVNDFANILPDDREATLESSLSTFRDETSNEIAVITVQNLGGDSIENYANELFREWGIGTKEKNNGVLLLVALEDRMTRIEGGYGLEGASTDLMAETIYREKLVPAFREERYIDGIEAAVTDLQSAARGEYSVPASSESNVPLALDTYGFALFFVLIWLSSFLARSKSIWAGGLIGGVIGIIGFLLFDNLILKIIALSLTPMAGLLLDWIVSRSYQHNIAKGGNGGFWGTRGGFGGFGGGSSGGFGGFSGGSSGGGGGGGSW